jgi:hypothetical protein
MTHSAPQSSKVYYFIALDDDWKPIHTTRACLRGDKETIDRGIKEMKILMLKDPSSSRIAVTEEIQAD